MTNFIQNLFICIFATLLANLVGVWWISLIILFCASFAIYWCTEKIKLFK